MLYLVKSLLMISLVAIVYQDFKDRHVFLWSLLMALIGFGYLHYQQRPAVSFLLPALLNMGIVLLIVFVLFSYARIRLKQPLADVFGPGDFLFFIVIAVGFPSLSFIILFSFSLFFSLAVYLMLKSKFKHKTVPLAGLQALFFGILFLLNWTFYFSSLYQL